MSCREEGSDCGESWKRRNGLILFGLLIIIFIVLSGFSFLDSRGQATPKDIKYKKFSAVEGKKVFQAYNCMGCHTIVGNGAYFAPDLTKHYELTGPAWLEAFLPSAGGWPTEEALIVQLSKRAVRRAAGTDDIEEYYKLYPGAKERVQRRGGQPTNMPNLPFTADEVGELIAFLKYTSEINTQGWPPKVKVINRDKLIRELHGEVVGVPTPPESTSVDENDAVAVGKKLTKNYGCLACHTTNGKPSVGPTWKGLYNHDVELEDGSIVKADEEYLSESITHPDNKIVKGYPLGVMPSFDSTLSDSDIDAMVEYIRSLE